MRWRASLGAMVAGLCITCAAAAQDGAISDEAKAYFKNGVELIRDKTPNYQDAIVQFRLAYEKSNKSWKVLGNLGLCALKLERDGEAIEYYTEYLKRGGDQLEADERKPIERDLLLLKGNLGTVTLSGAGLTQIVDQRQGSSAPPQVYTVTAGRLVLPLRAGSHTLVAKSAKGTEERWEIVLTPGQTAEHAFFGASSAGGPPPPAGPGAPPPSPAPADDPGAGMRLGGYVALGVGGVALLGGTFLGLSAKSSESSAKDQCRGNVCPERARSDFDSASSKATMSNIAFGVGALGVGAGVTLLVLGRKKGQEVSLAPWAVDKGGLMATGRF